MKNEILNVALSFRPHKTYTPEEILAAGGTTVFGRKFGKDNATLLQALANTAPIEPFTDEEWKQTFQQLNESK